MSVHYRGVYIPRSLLDMSALDRALLDALPSAPFGVNRTDHALNCLPERASADPPYYWSALMLLLHAIDRLVHPLAVIPDDPDPGSLWLSAS